MEGQEATIANLPNKYSEQSNVKPPRNGTYTKNIDVQALKDRVDFAGLVRETHEINESRYILCPAHDERTPSCRINGDYAYCFGCGWSGDHIGWLKMLYKLSFAGALRTLASRAGITTHTLATHHRKSTATKKQNASDNVQHTPWHPDQETALLDQHHTDASRWQAIAPDYLPPPLRHRGITQADLAILGIIELKDAAGLPIRNPFGRVVALKLRSMSNYYYFRGRRTGKDGQGKAIYAPYPPGTAHVIPAPHNPAWCSPGFGDDVAKPVLIIEGELNAAITYLALDDQIDVMGVAGANGNLYPDALTGRDVLVYADGDAPGQAALTRWAASAHEAGATRTRMLPPLPYNFDSCDLADRYGRAIIRTWLERYL